MWDIGHVCTQVQFVLIVLESAFSRPFSGEPLLSGEPVTLELLLQTGKEEQESDF